VRSLLRQLAPLLWLVALAFPGPGDRAAAAGMTAPPGIRPKDFAFVKKDGVYHLFYIRHNDFLPPFATELDFGHATSVDLHAWTQHPPVMPIDPYGWDNAHVWAPHIVEADGLWWMFYTGVAEKPGQFEDTQLMGLAVSSDLFTWTRVTPYWIYGTYDAPWALWNPRWAGTACRDPFVMRDPAAPDQWLMYYTATPLGDTLASVVGVARSDPHSLQTWADLKPLWITHRSLTFNALNESPHLFEHDGRWFLFVTTSSGQPLTFYTTANPIGEPVEWVYRGRLRTMLGWDTSSWGASEYLRDDTMELFAFVENTRIEIRKIVWLGNDNFTLDHVPLFRMRSMDWTRPETREGHEVGIVLESSNGFAFDGSLVARVRGADGQELVVPNAELGLPEYPTLDADSLVIPWNAQRWPPHAGVTDTVCVQLAMDDGSAVTPWLRVWPRSGGHPPGDGPGGIRFDIGGDPSPDPSPTSPSPDSIVVPLASAGAARPTLRPISGTPLGRVPAVALELTAPAGVRAEVFDLQGRRVALLADRPFGAGTHVLPWDGRDASGARARSGLYFVRATLPAGVVSTRLLLRD
jgi:hypothetical protein